MYKAIIVDDEYNIREGLKTIINWEEHGFSIVGQACDGVEALEVFNAAKPHLVITDIKMPRMNGINLAKELNEISPETKVIILSGYNDFSYAKEAIKYKVANYLLKPVDSTELTDVLKIVRDSVTKGLLAKRNESLRDSSLKNYFLLKLVRGELTEKEFNENAISYGLDTSSQNFCVLVFGLEKYNDYSTYLSESEIELKKHSIRTATEEILEKSGAGYFFDLSENLFGILFAVSEDGQDLVFRRVIEEIVENIKKHANESIDFCKGDIVLKRESIKKSYDKAMSGMKTYGFFENDSISKKDKSMNEIVKYIKQNYEQNLNLKKLADLFFINPIYLGQLFKKTTGRYYHDYINKIRIENAIRLFDETTLSINEVAEKVGYKYIDHFYRYFKIETGINPGDYRKNNSKHKIDSAATRIE